MQEIERKFLVTSEAFKNEAHKRNRIVQGFLNTNPERTVRVRIQGTDGFITVKGKSNKSGPTRYEWERQTSRAAAAELLHPCGPGIIRSSRYSTSLDNHAAEVDEVMGENGRSTVAAIRLDSGTGP